MKGPKPTRRIVVNDLEALQREFYQSYDEDYWLYKIFLLKEAHDKFDSVKGPLLENLIDVSESNFKKMLRTEMHFLYFQMIEAMFEMFFALARHDNRDLWVALTFSNEKDTAYYSNCYNSIRDFSKGIRNDFHPSRMMAVDIDGKNKDIPLLQWIFYFLSPTTLSVDEMGGNLENIRKLMRKFASDFADRKEYNAYKHSLRFYNSGYSLSISREGSAEHHLMGASDDAIYYLEHKPTEENTLVSTLHRVAKPFHFEDDFRWCMTIEALIRNMIVTRKHQLLKELHGKSYDFSLFNDKELLTKKAPHGVTRSSFTV